MTSDGSHLGPNSWLVEEMYERWAANPSSVDTEWQAFFRAESADGDSAAAAAPEAPAEPVPAAPTGETTAPVPAAPIGGTAEPVADGTSGRTAEPVADGTSGGTAEPVADGTSEGTAEPVAAAPTGDSAEDMAVDEPGEPIRGVGARIVENMAASLDVPTATSYRQVPAKLLEVNRKVINGYLSRTRGGKVSFTHIIAHAVVRAIDEVPAMRTTFTEGTDGSPRLIRHLHVGLGLAVDVERRDGSRSLLVPCIREADRLGFRDFVDAYEGLIAKVNDNEITPDDFAGTTISLTNVGTIGTVQSVPRLMPGQSVIVGVGAIGYPAEFQGADESTLADFGVSKVVTISSTYDHRIVQGAESGLFLRRIHDLLLGADGFYETIFSSLGVPYQAVQWRQDINPPDHEGSQLAKQIQVRKIVQMYRVRGHLIADLDPLAMKTPDMHAELDPATYGLTIWDLDREFLTDDLHGPERMKFGDILGVLRDAYSRTIGVEYMHMQDPGEKEWIQQQVERPKKPLDADDQRHVFVRLSAAEAFETFLHKRYVGHKRFGLEGGESAIVVLDTVLEEAARAGLAGAVLGMAHRGRLNVLSNLMGQPPEVMFRQFEGHVGLDTIQGSGDVKYHVGAETVFTTRHGDSMPVTLAANPSHLEAVDPVVIGMVRAMQDGVDEPGTFPVLPLLVHGDAAFAGQGVVAETLNLSNTPGYHVGGTVHLVINNQVGYTTAPVDSRSSPYATDVAKMVQAPIFHVNGDDPEACVRVARWAFAYRQAFWKDVVIDMYCYRRHGHNEGDDPSYTQPRLYKRIEAHRPVREKYVEALLKRGDITAEEADASLALHEQQLQDVLDSTRAAAPPERSVSRLPKPFHSDFSVVETGVPREIVDRLHEALYTWPEDFTVHPKLLRQFDNRRKLYESGEVDWGLAESLAYGSLLLEGRTVRLVGQDTRRGTFAHRHAALIDYEDEREHLPLRHLSDDQGRFFIYDSILSEYAALGVEYGYSVVDDEALVAWEAQFGDFVNGAQIIVDQFLAAGDDKWRQRSGLTLLLPHGYEGQGPEHSSARVERFLILCAEGNMTVANATTGAQFFHLLRRQAQTGNLRPLVVFTPKSLLRARQARSPIDDLVTGHFREVLDDPGVDDAAHNDVTTVVLASGKVAYDALARRDDEGWPAAIVRVEQLYPWPAEQLRDVIATYPNATRLVWLQEEPANMGGWLYVKGRGPLPNLPLRVVARPESGSPACGSLSVHNQELEQLMDDLQKECT